MSLIGKLADRTVVLFLGVGVGTAMGYAFADDIRETVSPASTEVAGGETMPFPAEGPQSSTEETPTGATGPEEPMAARAVVAQEIPASLDDQQLAMLAGEGKVRVGVFGDSFGDGLWSALYHQLPGKERFEVVKYSQQSTGFTRYKSLNLEQKLDEQLADGRIDVAVISFGANDMQGVVHNGKFAALLSPGWKATISRRVEAYIARLRQQGAAVYWVGLPVMRSASFDEQVAEMNSFYSELMTRLGVPFIDTRALTIDEKGQYAAYLPDPRTGAPRLMRANDGIHMSMNGYQRLTARLAGHIREHAKAAQQKARPKAEADPAENFNEELEAAQS